MEVNLGRPVAYGRTAEIYAWGESQVLKLFYDWFDLEAIETEARIGRAVHACGLPVPAVGELLQVNSRKGLVYQRIDGIPLSKAIERRPWRMPAFARRMAELHVEMHSSTVRADLPPQRRRLTRKINDARTLPDRLRIQALEALAALPDGSQVCHGDFHPDNILVTPSTEIIIDWIDASIGNPLADVARTSILALGSAGSSQVPNRLLKALLSRYHAIYLGHYFRLRPGGEAEYQCWLPVVAAARLSENIPEVEEWLMLQVKRLP